MDLLSSVIDGVSFYQGIKVNYFVPPPPLEKENGTPRKREPQPKERISYPGESDVETAKLPQLLKLTRPLCGLLLSQ